MNDYFIEERENEFKGDIYKTKNYYINEILVITKKIIITDNKIKILNYTIYPLENTDTREFYYNLYYNYSKQIDSNEEMIYDELYEEDGEIYNKFYIHDVNENSIEINPSGMNCIIVTIKNNKKTINDDMFDNLVIPICENFEKFNEYEGPKLI